MMEIAQLVENRELMRNEASLGGSTITKAQTHISVIKNTLPNPRKEEQKTQTMSTT